MTIERYRQYKRTLKAIPMKGNYVAYEWGYLSNSLHVTWMPYSLMFDEFSRELANIVNALTRYTHQLTAWRDVLTSMSQQQQLDAAVEIIDPLATTAINLPYVIRSRFIFATAHLCHQANRATQGKAWKDDFPLDNEVWFDVADKYGKGWNRYNSLKIRLEKLGAKDYRLDTQDFRNAYNHRFSPRIVLGISQVVARSVDNLTGAVAYGFQTTPALTLSHVVNLLETQCQHCYQAFEAFQLLIGEQGAAINTHNESALKNLNQNVTGH